MYIPVNSNACRFPNRYRGAVPGNGDSACSRGYSKMDMALFFSTYTWRRTDRRAREVLQAMAECSELQRRLHKSYGTATVCEIASSCQHKMRRASARREEEKCALTLA